MSPQAQQLLRLGALLLLVVSPLRWLWDYSMATETWMSLHDATTRTQIPKGLGQSLETVGGESQLAILAHPPARLEWSLPLRRGRHNFKVKLTIGEEAWAKSDGVIFRAAVIDQGQETEVGLWHLDPSSGPPRWVRANGNFSTSGQEVMLVLETSAGPRDHRDWDWAFWAEPRVMERTQPPHVPSILFGLLLLIATTFSRKGRRARA